MKNEFLTQKQLDNQYIVKVYEMTFNPYKSRLYLILEYVKGRELFDYICSNGALKGKIKELNKNE